MAGQDKSKSGRIYTKPAKTSKKFSAAGGRKGAKLIHNFCGRFHA